MGMWYNYTFARNDSANARCCPQGNNTNIGEWSFCTVEVGNGTDVFHSIGTEVNNCFVHKQNVTDLRLYLQDYPEHPPKASAARRMSPKPFGALVWTLIALSLASLSLAQDQITTKPDYALNPDANRNQTDQNQPLNEYLDYQHQWESEILKKYGRFRSQHMCTHFEPDDSSTWNLDGEMPPIAVGGQGVSDAGGAGSMHDERCYLNVTRRAEVPVTGDWTALEESIRAAIPADRMNRLRKEVYVPYVSDMFAWPGDPRSRTGQPAVSSAAVVISGTFSQCVNQTTPTHRGNVSVPYWDRLFYFTAMEPL